jgi:hypothetical protein
VHVATVAERWAVRWINAHRSSKKKQTYFYTFFFFALFVFLKSGALYPQRFRVLKQIYEKQENIPK